MKQRTITKSVSWKGVGLHTGADVELTINPASENFGRKVKRVDIEDGPWLPMDLRYVDSTNRSTNLKIRETETKTVEHVLSVLTALQIDNVQLLCNGPEFPIMDGSASQFYKDLSEAGITELELDKKHYKVTELFQYVDEESGAEYIVMPADELSVETIVEYDSDLIGNKHASLLSLSQFGEEISPARTYVFADEIVGLANSDLIKGGEITNAVVLNSPDVSSEELKNALEKLGKENVDKIIEKINAGFDLVFNNEPARHKILDLVGDLGLLGFDLKAKIIAKKPGHTGNVALARVLKEKYQKHIKLGGLPKYDPLKPPVYNIEQIQGILPHRYPFLMVDKIIEVSDNMVIGVKNITFDESLFQGHFPNNSVFPGVLQMEALAQAGGILALRKVEIPSNWDTYFVKMDNVKFKRKVVPGDTLILKMELVGPIRRGMVNMKGTAYVGESIVSEGELVAQIVDRTKTKP